MEDNLKKRISIKYKLLTGYSFIFFFAFIVFNYFMYNAINKNNKKIITEQMWTIKNSADMYTNQFFMFNNLDINKENLKNYSIEISEKISNGVGLPVKVYSKEGQVLGCTNEELRFIKDKEEYINLALDYKAAYYISHGKVRKSVSFFYPIIGNKEIIGIFNFSKDYSRLYGDGERLLKLVRIFSTTLFLIIFIFSLVISNKITKPIIKLSKHTKEIQKGNYNINLNYSSNDEIGELSQNFSNMTCTIKDQIQIIEEDRDELIKLNNHRKEFFDNVTHELKTPLTIILGYGEALKEEGSNDKEFFNKAIDHICSESKRLHKMVLELLDISFGERIDIEKEAEDIDLSCVLKNTCEDMRIKAKRYGNHFETYIDDELIIRGIKDKLKEVFINIIDNSIKYGNVNTAITIKAFKEDNIIKIMFIDKGKGIPQDKLQDVCKPFIRANKKEAREKGSNGLGLYIVNQIIDLHKGSIGIKSVENEGTEVVLQFISI